MKTEASLPLDPRLADTYVELALEEPSTAGRWLTTGLAPGHRRLERGLLRLEWLKSGTDSLGVWLRSHGGVAPSVINEFRSIPTGSDPRAVKQTALALERAGDPLWAIDILGRRLTNWGVQGHHARLLVDYGLWDRAEEVFRSTRNNSLDMGIAQAMLALAKGDPEGARASLERVQNATPQVRRLAELVSRVGDPFQAIRAWHLAMQMRLYSLAVAILGAGPRTDIEVERAYKSHRMAQADQRRAYTRVRRRYRIRGVGLTIGSADNFDGD